MKILFKNAKVFDLDAENGYFEGCVEVEDNKIVNVVDKSKYCCKKCKGENEKQFDRVIDVKGNILMPGFVDTHCHTPMVLLRGIKDDVNLQDWLFNTIFPLEATLTADDIYWGEMLGIAEYVRGGITTIDENYYSHGAMCSALSKAGLRARVTIGPSIPGKDEDNENYCQTQLNEVLSSSDLSLIKPSLFVHAIYTISEPKILSSIDFAIKNNLDLSIHLSETLTEVGECTTKHNNMTPPQYLESLGFFDRQNVLCAHCVHMDKDDLQILADNDVAVAINPASNLKLASGIPPIYAMLNKGINVTIGTDGASSNNSLDMFKEMFLACTLPKGHLNMPEIVSAKEVLQMATINGAKALGVNSGEIKVGKFADLIIVDISNPHMHPLTNVFSALVYCAKSSDICLTMVNGKILYENGNYNIGENISDIYKNCDIIRARLEAKNFSNN